MKFRQMVWSQIKIRFEVIPDEPFQWEGMQCVFEGSSLKSAGADGDIINAHDKNHTARCDKGKNEFLKFCFWHSKPSL